MITKGARGSWSMGPMSTVKSSGSGAIGGAMVVDPNTMVW